MFMTSDHLLIKDYFEFKMTTNLLIQLDSTIKAHQLLGLDVVHLRLPTYTPPHATKDLKYN